MAGKCRPSLREKTLEIVKHSNLSQTNKDCIAEVFKRYEEAQAEIERLTNKCESVFLCHDEEIGQAKKQARAETITEFAKRLKEKAYTESTITGYRYMVVDVCEIDQIAKEMKEGVNNA